MLKKKEMLKIPYSLTTVNMLSREWERTVHQLLQNIFPVILVWLVLISKLYPMKGNKGVACVLEADCSLRTKLTNAGRNVQQLHSHRVTDTKLSQYTGR